MSGLRVAGLSKTFGSTRVLDSLDLEVSDGITAVLGPSGCGKTTLLRAIAGLVPVEAGYIGCGSLAALVLQQHALAPRLSARDNVLVGVLGWIGFWRAALRAWPRAELAEVTACLARVGLDGLGPRRADRDRS